MENFLETDCTPDMFPEYPQPPTAGGTFAVGKKKLLLDIQSDRGNIWGGGG